jgi:hypothetical protein
VALGAAYQLDIRGDRSAAYSELGVAEGVIRFGRGSAEGSVEFDLGGGVLNHARLTVRSPPVRNTALVAEVRRYHPYFELWTIWGAFSPVGFSELRAGATWASSDGDVMARGDLSFRNYDDAETGAPDAFMGSSWGLGGHVSWSPAISWRTEAGYRVEGGFGAGRWDGQASVRRDLRGSSLGIHVIAFQRLYEFRLGEGTVVGIGGEAMLPLGERGRLFAALTTYRQHGGIPTALDWNQRRASLRYEWILGSEPAAQRAGGVP